MNRIIDSFLDNHINEYELTGKREASFEHFINFIVTRNYTSRHFDPDIVGTDAGEVGIDGLAIVVNDVIVSSVEEVESIFSSTSKDISVSFIFTQAKTSDKFDSHDISLFATAVINFFSQDVKKIKMNDKMDELVKVSEYIFQNAIKMSRNPDCHLYYVSTGKWVNDATISTIIDQTKASLKSTSYFDGITFTMYDHERISTVYRNIKNSITKEVVIDSIATISSIPNVKESYIGTIKCSDFINLISNEEGLLITSLFEDNVRYFQGRNTVNMEIQQTIDVPEMQQAFSLLNNGVTIVAKSMRRTGNMFILSDFQIVNGCQTSFMLYENKDKIHHDTYLVVKLISTEDKDITDSIIKSTNRQTPVLTEAFETLRDFHKDLENIYSSYDAEYRLYYERRSKQYDSLDVNKNKVISFPSQTTAYVAMFMGEPQSTHRYYGELLQAYSKRIYNSSDRLEQYCISSMYLFQVEKYLRERKTYNNYKHFKYHIIFLLRCLIHASVLPRANSNEMERLCEKLFEIMKNTSNFGTLIDKACLAIDTVIKKNSGKKQETDLARSKDFTNALLNQLHINVAYTSIDRETLPLEKGNIFDCIVIGFGTAFAYVEIVDHKDYGQIHISEIADYYITSISHELKKGQIVKAKLIDNVRHSLYGWTLSIKQVI
jgi:hypothetical protein